MGSCFVSVEFDEMPADQMKKVYASHQQHLRMEYGYEPYNGTLSHCDLTRVDGSIYNSHQEADAWLADNTAKREAKAVKFRVVPDFAKEKKGVALLAKINDLEKKRVDYVREANAKALPKDRTAPAPVKCSECKSKLNYPNAHRLPENCPVCGKQSFRLTEANRKTIAKLAEDIKQARLKYAEEQKAFHIKVAPKCPTKWLVGGWAPC